MFVCPALSVLRQSKGFLPFQFPLRPPLREGRLCQEEEREEEEGQGREQRRGGGAGEK